MKKLLLGIAILLFAILAELAHEGHFAYLSTGVGIIGLVIALFGFFDRK